MKKQQHTTERPQRGFVHKQMEVNGRLMHVTSINISTISVMENNRIVRYPISSVNSADLSLIKSICFGSL